MSLGFEQEVMFVARTNCWNISWKVIKNFFTAQSTLKVMIPVLSLSNSLKIWLMKTFALKHKHQSLLLILLNQNFWPLTYVSAWHTCHKCSPSSADQEDTQRQSRYTSTELYQASWYVGMAAPEPLPDLLLVVPGVVPQVLDVLWGQPRLPAVLVPHEPPPLSWQLTHYFKLLESVDNIISRLLTGFFMTPLAQAT